MGESTVKLTIITINRNNAAGLEKTLSSVLQQTRKDYQYVVVDGASTDKSIETIRRFASQFGERLRWVSEPDTGIYNAMNKGIRLAEGEYLQFLNSGDLLASSDVVDLMFDALAKNGHPSILYGNMLKQMPNGLILRDRSFAGQEITFLGFYRGTLNHSPAYIKRALFDKYGLYDETLKIVSDWKWYLQAIVLGEEKPAYADIDVTVFDMTGISETNHSLLDQEKTSELQSMIPAALLQDYQSWSFPIDQMRRLKRHPWAYGLVWFIERVLFKLEKMKNRFRKEV